jgi:hypothetical protein
MWKTQGIAFVHPWHVDTMVVAIRLGYYSPVLEDFILIKN